MDVNILAIGILSLTLLISISLCYKFYNKIVDLEELLYKSKNELEIAKRDKDNARKDRDNFIAIKVGDKVLHDASLTHTDKATNNVTSFKLLYELEVIEVSRNKLKVKALDYTSNDSFPRDPANKQSLITYMTNKWIDKVEAQPIINTTKLNRANKIDSLLKKP